MLRVLFLFLVLTMVSCSSRVVYNAPRAAVLSPDAVNINTATAEQLEKLPHVGRKTAEAIIAFRDENGSFRRPENLLLIRGISESRFADIRQFIRTE